jgi:hypothetical protein
MLKHIFPNAQRHFEFRFQEAHGIDLDNTGRYKFQCKWYRDYVPISKIFEIKSEPLLGDIPVLVTASQNDSQGSRPPMAVLPLACLIELIERTEKK